MASIELQIWITLWVLCCLVWISESGLKPCTFPKAWQGRWFQHGVGEVVFSENSLSTKGNCLERRREFFLIQNKNEHCHQCLIILDRHHNLIQYKESYCIGRDSLQSICALIRIEADLHTLVREPATPIPCPFAGAYHFTYSNNSGGYCRSPMSYVHQCASHTKFRFGFRHCRHTMFTEDKDLELHCLAKWKQSSGLYLYGRVSGDGVIYHDDSYRCFMYEFLGPVGYLSVSSDGSCSQLKSAREGSTTMELTQDRYGWPQPKCTFPNWLTHDVWRDLSSKHVYHSNDPHAEVIQISYRAHHERHSHVLTSYQCMDMVRRNSSLGEEILVLAYTLEQCVKQYQCIRVIRRQPGVLEVHRGNSVAFSHGRCTDDDFEPNIKHLLIPNIMMENPCPFQGRYTSTSDVIARCVVEVTAGCKHKQRMDITSSCFSRPVAQFECVQSWEEGNKTYLIVKKWKHPKGLANCYSFREEKSSLVFGLDPGCNHHVGVIARQQVDFKLQNRQEECLPRHPLPEVGDNRQQEMVYDVQQTDEGDSPDPGGGYEIHANDQPDEEEGEERETNQPAYSLDVPSRAVPIHRLPRSAAAMLVTFLLVNFAGCR